MKKKSTIQWIAEFASIHKKTYVFSVVFAVFGVFCAIAPYFVIGNMVKELLIGNKNFRFFLNQCLWLVGFWTARVLFHAASTTLSHKATFHVLAVIRQRVCDKLYKLPLGYVCDHSSGGIKNVLVERIDSIETTLAHVLPEFTANLLGPVCVIVYLFTIDLRMALLSLVTVPIGMLCYMGMCIGYEESYQNTIIKTKVLNDTAVEYINGIEVIKAFGKAESSYEKFVVAAREGVACFVEWMRRCNIFMSLAMSIFPATLMAVLPFGGMFYQNGTLSATSFIVIIILSLGIVGPIITCASYTDDIRKIQTIITEVTDILEQEEMIRPEKQSRQINGTDIELTDVSFGYREKEILHGICMKLKAGTVNALVGPSGSGKTTLCNLMARFWDVQKGTVKLGGVDVRKYNIDSLMKNFSFVFQSVYLFEDTIANNIRFGQPEASMEQVIEAAKKACCHDFIMKLPNGYDTIIGEGGASLSGGEKQRISIARAIMKDAPIIILDEATANVDPENEKELVNAIEALTKEKTIIMIAHRLKTVRNADNILVVDQGRIVEHGKHEQLMKLDGIYKRFIQTRELAVGWKL